MVALELLASLAGAGVTVTADSDRLVVHPGSKLTEAMRTAMRDVKPALLALVAADQPSDKHVMPELASVSCNDQDIVRFLELQARLARWRWAEPDAVFMAERLVRRDRGQDDRVSCIECRHFRPGRCGNHRRAGLSTSEVGHDLAGLLQRCPGFQAGSQPPADRHDAVSMLPGGTAFRAGRICWTAGCDAATPQPRTQKTEPLGGTFGGIS